MVDPIVVFSPLPPAKSGIADYMLELLPTLSAQREVVVVTESPPASGDNWRTVTPEQYRGDTALAPLPHFYQIGNNADHVFVYRACRERPGIVVQHDFNLHYLVEDATLVAGDLAGYRRILEEEYGESGATLADLRQLGVFSEAQKLTLGLNTHLLREARGVIVHSRWVQERLPADIQARSTVIQHHFAPQALAYEDASRAEARAALGIDQDAFVLLALGYITPPKQVQAALAAVAMLRDRHPQLQFVVGGQRNPGFDIDAVIRQHQLEDRARITGYLDEAAFFRHIVAADALVNLRYPTVGESSGTLARSLALGLPAIIHNFGPASELPEGTVLKVPLELGPPTRLAAAIDSLASNAALRAALGEAARDYMLANRSVALSAEGYNAFSDLIYGLGPRHDANVVSLSRKPSHEYQGTRRKGR